MMMAIEESLVDIGKLPHGINFAERAISHGVFGRHPGECASAELGRKALDMISSRTAGLVRAVDESGSIEPYKAALKEFDKLYFRTFNPFSLKRLFMLQGISSAREGWEYLKWITLRNGRCETDYHYPGK
jgi:hypothetical protein